MEISKKEIAKAKSVFKEHIEGDLEKLDACKLGNALRCMELTPSLKYVYSIGGEKRAGEKSFTFDEFLGLYKKAKSEQEEVGTYFDYLECMRLYDKEGSGKININQLGHVLTYYGEPLTAYEMETIIYDCAGDADDEGMISYEPFVKKICEGPPFSRLRLDDYQEPEPEDMEVRDEGQIADLKATVKQPPASQQEEGDDTPVTSFSLEANAED